MSGQAVEPMVTLTMSQGDWQLVMQVLSQALAPYHRLGVVMQGMQAQAAREAARVQQSEQVEAIQRGPQGPLQGQTGSLQGMQHGQVGQASFEDAHAKQTARLAHAHGVVS
jgi:hypothetical protein